MSGRLIAKTSHGDPAQFTAEVTSLGACPMSMIPKETPTGQPQCVSLVQTRLPALAMHNGRTSVLIPSTTTVGAPQKCILAQSHVLWTSRFVSIMPIWQMVNRILTRLEPRLVLQWMQAAPVTRSGRRSVLILFTTTVGALRKRILAQSHVLWTSSIATKSPT